MRPSRSGHGDGLDTPYDETQPASQDRHSTGTPKGSADEAVQLRLGEEAQTLNFAYNRISSDEAKHTAQDRTGWKTVVKALCSGRDEEDYVSKVKTV